MVEIDSLVGRRMDRTLIGDVILLFLVKMIALGNNRVDDGINVALCLFKFFLDCRLPSLMDLLDDDFVADVEGS